MCLDPNGNSLEVVVPGVETPLLILCSKTEKHNDFYRGLHKFMKNCLYNALVILINIFQDCG